MKRFYILIILLIVVGISLGKQYTLKSYQPIPTPSALTESIPTQSAPEVRYYSPKLLNIPKIGISANVESVGLDSQGRMDVPKQALNVGWYNLGFKAGEKGSVVLDGHFDDVNGAPAVFYNLGKLSVGDEIILIDENDKQFKYKVTDSKIYDFDKLPLKEIFASTDKARLNLITCNGVFDQSEKNYSKRLVIYSELID